MTFKFLFTTLLIFTITMNEQSQKKSLIVYYSWGGNTKVIAEDIREITGADIFRIEPVDAYPTDYQTVVDQAKEEINRGYHPKLKATVKNFDSYDTIYVGSPDWWSTVAPPAATFLTSYNFKGKVIIPFMTHGGSGFGRSIADIKKMCPGATVLKGYACYGTQVKDAKAEVRLWLKGLGKVYE